MINGLQDRGVVLILRRVIEGARDSRMEQGRVRLPSVRDELLKNGSST